MGLWKKVKSAGKSLKKAARNLALGTALALPGAAAFMATPNEAQAQTPDVNLVDFELNLSDRYAEGFDGTGSTGRSDGNFLNVGFTPFTLNTLPITFNAGLASAEDGPITQIFQRGLQFTELSASLDNNATGTRSTTRFGISAGLVQPYSVTMADMLSPGGNASFLRSSADGLVGGAPMLGGRGLLSFALSGGDETLQDIAFNSFLRDDFVIGGQRPGTHLSFFGSGGYSTQLGWGFDEQAGGPFSRTLLGGADPNLFYLQGGVDVTHVFDGGSLAARFTFVTRRGSNPAPTCIPGTETGNGTCQIDQSDTGGFADENRYIGSVAYRQRIGDGPLSVSAGANIAHADNADGIKGGSLTAVNTALAAELAWDVLRRSTLTLLASGQLDGNWGSDNLFERGVLAPSFRGVAQVGGCLTTRNEVGVAQPLDPNPQQSESVGFQFCTTAGVQHNAFDDSVVTPGVRGNSWFVNANALFRFKGL